MIEQNIPEKLGFQSFHHYLGSKFFQEMKKMILVRDGHECSFCDNKASLVFFSYRSRKALTGEDTVSVFSSCVRCYDSIHLTKKGIRVGQKSVQQRTMRKAVRYSDLPNIGLMMKDRYVRFQEHTDYISSACQCMTKKDGTVKLKFL